MMAVWRSLPERSLQRCVGRLSLALVVSGIWSILAPPASALFSVDVGSATGPAGQSVQIDVRLTSGGGEAIATQNDILFQPALVDLVKASDCRINSDISLLTEDCQDDPTCCPCKNLSRDLADCPGAEGCPRLCEAGDNAGNACASDQDCPAGTCVADPAFDGYRRFRGIILSLDNTNSIDQSGNGVVLYTCTFTITEGASGVATLTNLNTRASDASGDSLDVVGDDGEIIIAAAGASPTPTSTQAPSSPTAPSATPASPTPAATPGPAGGVTLIVGDASGDPGESVTVTVQFFPGQPDGMPGGADEISLLGFLLDFHRPPDLDFDPTDADADGVPDAIVFNPDGNPDLDRFVLGVLNPDLAATTRILDIEVGLASGDTDTIPGGTLMTVSLIIPPQSPGSEHSIEPREVRAFDRNGTRFSATSLVTGVVRANAPPPPDTPGPIQVDIDTKGGGCAVVAASTSLHAPFWLLVGLLMVRRGRSRSAGSLGRLVTAKRQHHGSPRRMPTA
jgi:hypothetical protein